MRVVICEDSVLLREGLVRLLVDAGHEIVAALPDTTGLVDAIAGAEIDLAVLDVRLPPTFTDEGIRAALDLRARFASLNVLVLSQYVEERYASDLISERRGGIGYLLKDRVVDVAEFLESLATVGSGGTVLDPEVVAQLLARKRRDTRLSVLSERESTVLGLMAEGKSNAAIAETLHVSAGSVEKHISSLFQKLNLEQDQSGNRRVLAVLAHLNADTNLRPETRSS
ncbi:LuxR C-terminal-related transcriptional regulator [Humidisolicoccus flavus]|uniref:LuxR C-terminal-related transcriptional regulator n=1 Tax=Humidisolicoccus flavus TaxID=3111414 RepID=UPI003254D170